MPVKRTTLIDRLRAASNAFLGKTVGTIHMDVSVHKCKECEYKQEEKRKVFYICDRKACDSCDNPNCKHTHKIEHAKNFKSNKELGMNNGYDDYWESEPEIANGSSYFLTPENEEVSLYECPVGLFEYEGTLGVKTEYCTTTSTGIKIDAYIVSTGERFCIPNDAMVKPCGVWIADDGDSNE